MPVVVVALADTSCWRIGYSGGDALPAWRCVRAESGFCGGGGRTVTAAESAVRKRPRERERDKDREREGGGGRHKRQVLVYDILPSTTAVFSYAIGP